MTEEQWQDIIHHRRQEKREMFMFAMATVYLIAVSTFVGAVVFIFWQKYG